MDASAEARGDGAEALAIVEACMQVKHLLGAGHLEKVYQRVLIEKLLAAGFEVQQEIVIPVRAAWFVSLFSSSLGWELL